MAKLKLMDYSLLVGIHTCEEGEPPIEDDVDVFAITSDEGIYLFIYICICLYRIIYHIYIFFYSMFFFIIN